jgi:tetrahydromethanopterin S-methyltransferase subunit G
MSCDPAAWVGFEIGVFFGVVITLLVVIGLAWAVFVSMHKS